MHIGHDVNLPAPAIDVRAEFWDASLGNSLEYSCEKIAEAASILAQCRKGIPESYRGRVWRWLVATEVRRLERCPPESGVDRNTEESYAHLKTLPEDAAHVRDTVLWDRLMVSPHSTAVGQQRS